MCLAAAPAANHLGRHDPRHKWPTAAGRVTNADFTVRSYTSFAAVSRSERLPASSRRDDEPWDDVHFGEVPPFTLPFA